VANREKRIEKFLWAFTPRGGMGADEIECVQKERCIRVMYVLIGLLEYTFIYRGHLKIVEKGRTKKKLKILKYTVWNCREKL
jgi:hypothetical protein